MECPKCNGSGLVEAGSEDTNATDEKADAQGQQNPSDSKVKCPTCKGHGRIPWYNFPLW